MPAITPALSNELQVVLQRALDVLKGTGSTSFLGLASTIALKRFGFTHDLVLYLRHQENEASAPDLEVALAFKILSIHFKGLSDQKLLQILDLLSSPEYNNLSDQEWGKAFDFCLEKYKPVLGKKSTFVYPLELAQLVISIYTINKEDTIYSPLSGACSVAQYLPEDVKLNAQELQDEEWAIGKLRLTSYGLNNNVHLSHCNPIKEWDNKQYDFIFSFPLNENASTSYESQYSVSNSIADCLLERFIPAALNGSKVVVLVPYWFLASHKNLLLRQHLVDYDLIESVTLLPNKIYAACPSSVALLCLNKQKKNNNKILFFDADDVMIESDSGRSTIGVDKVLDVLHGKSEVAEAKFISTGMVKKRNHSLHPKRHLLDLAHGLQESEHLVRLESIATVIRSKGRSHEATEADCILIRDLSDDTEDFKLKHQLFKPDAAREDYATVLNEPCLLIALAWHTPKPTWFTGDREKPVCVGDEICALQIDTSRVDIAYLVSELRSEFFTYQFSVRKGGMQSLFADDLLRLEIRLPV